MTSRRILNRQSGGCLLPASAANATMSAQKRFAGFKHETESGQRKAEVIENPTSLVRNLLSAWPSLDLELFSPGLSPSMSEAEFVRKTYADAYSKMRELFSGLTITSKEIEGISMSLPFLVADSDKTDKVGLVLSALINFSADKEFTLITSNFQFPPDLIGYQNAKIIRVNGDVGDMAGFSMRGGMLIVNGDTRGRCGEQMEDGEIHVYGKITRDRFRTFAPYGNVRGGRILEIYQEKTTAMERVAPLSEDSCSEEDFRWTTHDNK